MITDELLREIKGMRKSLISWRTSCYPDNDQAKVVDRDYPTVAKLINGTKDDTVDRLISLREKCKNCPAPDAGLCGQCFD